MEQCRKSCRRIALKVIMSLSTEFLNYCSEFLDADFGAISEGIIDKVLSKKKLDDSHNPVSYVTFPVML